MAVWTKRSAGWKSAFSIWLKRCLPRRRRHAAIPLDELPDALRLDVAAPPQALPTRQDDLWNRIRAAKLPPL